MLRLPPNRLYLAPPLFAFFAALCTVALLGLAEGAQAKGKPATVRVALPAPGQADVSFASVKLRKGTKPPRLSVGSAPAGVIVAGAVGKDGRLAIAVANPGGGKAAKAAGGARIAIKVAGRAKPKGVRTARDVLAKGDGAPAEACGDLATLLGKGLRGVSGGDAAALGRALGSRACGGEVAPADAAVLAKLGLTVPGAKPLGSPAGPGSSPAATLAAATKAAPPRPSGPSKPAPKPGGDTKPGGGGTNPGNEVKDACSNGLDDDGDGQTDFRGPGKANPDPGCASASDAIEGDELEVVAECANFSGVFGGANGPQTATAAINNGCPIVEEVWMTIAPGVAGCVASSASSNYDCVAEHGLLHSKRTGGAADNQIDFLTINLTGNLDCSKPTTIAITSPDGFTSELVEPLPANACQAGPPPPPPGPKQCADGVDNDNDGQRDHLSKQGATDPDPGCTDQNDDSEGSEITPPAGCIVTIGFLGLDERDTAFSASGCGELMGAWFSPARTPLSCEYRLGQNDPVGCEVFGSVGTASFVDSSTEDLTVYAPVAQEPACGAGLTAALRRTDGTVIEQRGFWDC